MVGDKYVKPFAAVDERQCFLGRGCLDDAIASSSNMSAVLIRTSISSSKFRAVLHRQPPELHARAILRLGPSHRKPVLCSAVRECGQSARGRQHGYPIRLVTPCDFPFARDGIAAEASENIAALTIADVNLADLTWARAEGTVRNLADRRFDLYRIDWNRSEPRNDAPPTPPPHRSKTPGGG